MIVASVFLASFLAQENKTILRQEKNEYNTAVTKCREAESLIESDPQQAVEAFTQVLALPKIRAWECTIKIELRPGEYSEPYNFLPYQYRARARMVLAKKASPEAAQRFLASAVEDLRESVKRNVPASADLLKTAESTLAKLKADLARPSDPVKVDPVTRFKEVWDPLLTQNRFKAAKAAVESEGEALGEELKKSFLQSTEQACRDFLIRWVAAFRPSFTSAMATGLDQKTPEEFDLLFALPAPDELVVPNPTLDWVRQFLPAFRNVQLQKAPASSLAAAALASVTLEERSENPWFKSVEGAIFQSLKGSIADQAAQAQDAARVEREKARAEADASLAQWKSFVGNLDPKFVERHRFLRDHETQLVRLFEGFPVDLAELGSVTPAIDAAFGSDAPDQELSKLEETLAALETKGLLARESRQRLYTLRVTIGALRGLLGGKDEPAVAADLSGFRQKLRDSGGPEGDVKKYGPRVERVFAELR